MSRLMSARCLRSCGRHGTRAHIGRHRIWVLRVRLDRSLVREPAICIRIDLLPGGKLHTRGAVHRDGAVEDLIRFVPFGAPGSRTRCAHLSADGMPADLEACAGCQVLNRCECAADLLEERCGLQVAGFLQLHAVSVTKCPVTCGRRNRPGTEWPRARRRRCGSRCPGSAPGWYSGVPVDVDGRVDHDQCGRGIDRGLRLNNEEVVAAPAARSTARTITSRQPPQPNPQPRPKQPPLAWRGGGSGLLLSVAPAAAVSPFAGKIYCWLSRNRTIKRGGSFERKCAHASRLAQTSPTTRSLRSPRSLASFRTGYSLRVKSVEPVYVWRRWPSAPGRARRLCAQGDGLAAGPKREKPASAGVFTV